MAKDRTVRLKAQKKYDEAHRQDYKAFYIKCNRLTDADIIDYLEVIPNKQGFIKNLIRKEIIGGN